MTGRPLVPLLLAASILTGCATLPPAPQGEEVWGLLPGGSPLYLSARIDRDPGLYRDFLALTGRENLSGAVERIDRIYLAANPYGLPNPEFAAAVTGDFPRQYIRYRLARQEGWSERSGRIEGRAMSWWTSADTPLQLSLPSGELLAAASGGVEIMLRQYLLREPAAGPPPDIMQEAEGRDILVYLPEPARALERVLPAPLRRVSLERAWFSLDGEPSADGVPADYRMSGVIVFSREQDARAFLILFRLAAVAWLAERGIASPVEAYRLVHVERAGESLIFTGGPIGREAVLLLLAGLPLPSAAADG